jgi:hypothetical protein
MHKILNWLFGWDYIAWKNGAGQGIARLQPDFLDSFELSND